MLKQLSLWPIAKEPSIWQTLDHEQQQQVTTTLAHLIQKIIYLKKEQQTKEVNNEQQ